MAKDRLSAIKAASKKAAAPSSPFSPGMNKHSAQKAGARTGWNPNPEIAPVKTILPEGARPKLKPPASRWSPPMDQGSPTARSSPSRRPPAPADELLDRAKAKRQARAAPTPPSGAITGPKLREGYSPSSRYSPPMDVRSSTARVSVRTVRPGRPPPAPPAPAPAAPASQPKPRLTSSARTPRSRVSPPMARPAAVPKRTRVGGGRLGALASAGINAAQAVYSEATRKKKDK